MRKTLLTVLVLGALMPIWAAAQTQITTGAIEGTIVDSQGALVEGALKRLSPTRRSSGAISKTC